jgi:phosphatidylglycerophosphatase A
MRNFCKKIVTFGPVGYRKGSGSWATLCALPLVWQVSSTVSLSCVVIAFFVAALVISFPLFDTHDPGEIVADEAIGFTVAMYGVSHAGWLYLLGFILFRLFDITKICGIRSFERLPGVLGIVMDDVVAGLYTNLLLRLCTCYFL